MKYQNNINNYQEHAFDKISSYFILEFEIAFNRSIGASMPVTIGISDNTGTNLDIVALIVCTTINVHIRLKAFGGRSAWSPYLRLAREIVSSFILNKEKKLYIPTCP